MNKWILVFHTTFSENLQGVRVKKTIREFATQSAARNAMGEHFSAYVRANVQTLELATIDADEAVVAYGGGAVEHSFIIFTGDVRK